MRRMMRFVVCFVLFALSGFTLYRTPARAGLKLPDSLVDTYITDDVTPAEPASSDLEVVQSVTKLDSKRWIQSYTMDSKYYYFIQMTSASKGHLRITRVKYTGLGRYIKDHMDLKFFGHATNLDCSVHNGVTWLWTGSDCASGSDVSRAVTCFKYRKNGVLYHHGQYYYRIPKGKYGKYVTNVYPAVNEKNTRLAVRFTYKGKQHFQTYKLKNGTQIDTRDPMRCISYSGTSGDFQGFDIYGNKTIYTIEGSPSKVFLAGYDKNRIYHPTIIRTLHLADHTADYKIITGARKLSFREPEGIKVLKGRTKYIMFVSFRLTDQSCNIYRVK